MGMSSRLSKYKYDYEWKRGKGPDIIDVFDGGYYLYSIILDSGFCSLYTKNAKYRCK